MKESPELTLILAEALKSPLPADEAWSTMRPPYRGIRPEDTRAYRRAAVLILLYPREGMWRLPLVLRSSEHGSHRGQIGLPGGGIEPGECPEEAALREAVEEVGLDPSPVRMLGRLSELPVEPSRYRVLPVLAEAPSPPLLKPASEEIEEVFEIELGELLAPCSATRVTRTFEGRAWSVPAYILGGREVWGATAMILAELRAVLLG